MNSYLRVLPLILAALLVFVNTSAYGLWVPETTEMLLEQSETVFVGTITSVNVLEFERSNTYDVIENGVSRIIIENYTQTLDEYTVSIEEFLKNPQESHTITMLEATVGGVPGRSVSIGGFELGDRVLFYVPKIDGTNQYSPESFKIPKHCNAKSVLEKPKIDGVNDFRMMQDGTIIQNNFTANKKIQFVFDKDLRTLNGAGFSVDVAISKIIDKKSQQPILQENIHAESKPCEWIASAKWDFVPTAGEYAMWMSNAEDGNSGRSTYSGGFSVIENTSIKTQLNPHVSNTMVTSPLQQFESGIPIDKIQCKEGLQLVTKASNGNPACVKQETAEKLIERGWGSKLETTSDSKTPIPSLDKKYTLQVNGNIFEIRYSVIGSQLQEITADHNARFIVVNLENSEKGQMTIEIPRKVIDAKNGLEGASAEDVDFIVLVDGSEVDFEEIRSTVTRTLTIPLENDSFQIEIIGNFGYP